MMKRSFNVDEIARLWAVQAPIEPSLLIGAPKPIVFGRVFNSVKDGLKADWKKRFENRTVTDQPKGQAFEIKNGTGDTTEILLYDEIGFWGITAKRFVDQLKNVTTKNILLRINSPGGDVFDGIAIHNALKQHGAKITVRVDGWAASIASIIALAGETIEMAPASFMMIHRAWGIALGNAADFENMVGILTKLDNTLANLYAAKTGKTAAAMLDLMKGDVDGTWFTAEEAKDIGLADEIFQPEEDTTAAAAAAALTLNAEQLSLLNRNRQRLALAAVEV